MERPFSIFFNTLRDSGRNNSNSPVEVNLVSKRGNPDNWDSLIKESFGDLTNHNVVITIAASPHTNTFFRIGQTEFPAHFIVWVKTPIESESIPGIAGLETNEENLKSVLNSIRQAREMLLLRDFSNKQIAVYSSIGYTFDKQNYGPSPQSVSFFHLHIAALPEINTKSNDQISAYDIMKIYSQVSQWANPVTENFSNFLNEKQKFNNIPIIKSELINASGVEGIRIKCSSEIDYLRFLQSFGSCWGEIYKLLLRKKPNYNELEKLLKKWDLPLTMITEIKNFASKFREDWQNVSLRLRLPQNMPWKFYINFNDQNQIESVDIYPVFLSFGSNAMESLIKARLIRP